MSTHASHGETSGHGHAQVGHLVPIALLVKTAVALLALTAVTLWAASYDFGNVNVWIALSIAAIKGSLVVLFFMHLRWDRPFNGVIFLTALTLVALFISFTLTDTSEYAPEILKGNAPMAQQEIDTVRQELQQAEGKAEHGGGTPH